MKEGEDLKKRQDNIGWLLLLMFGIFLSFIGASTYSQCTKLGTECYSADKKESRMD